jgi:hypothetical protein
MAARDPELTIIRHAPERGKGAAPQILPAGCCCCCCCCLHTMGGIAGAIVGSATRMESRPVYETDPDSPFPFRRDVFEEDVPLISPVLLYWLAVALAVFVTVGVTALMIGGGPGMNDPFSLLAAGFFVAVMLLPGLQLIASLVAVVLVAIFYPERGYSLRRLSRITLYCFGGALVGTLLMGGCLGVLYVAN